MANKIKDSNITPGTIAADKLAGSIPNSKLSNTGVTINGTTIALGASGNIVAGTDWQAVKTANYTAVAGQGIFANTTGGAFTITLPASPTIGDEVTIFDYAGTFATNNLTVARNSSKIDTANADTTLQVNRTNVRFVFIDTTQGWRSVFDDVSTDYGPQYVTATGGTVSTSGNYKIHTFNSTGNFVVSAGGSPGGSDKVSYVVVAGGGGAGHTAAGGGGAGGFREGIDAPKDSYTDSPLAVQTGLSVSAQTYPITVGGGGATGGPTVAGAVGSNSVFSTITSAGGGGGAGGSGPGAGTVASAGGSGGGGGGGTSNSTIAPGGAGNTPPVSPSQGNPGGTTPTPGGAPSYAGSGGGGAGTAGTTGGTSTAGNGGNGVASSITGSAVTRAGGGGASNDANQAPVGLGGPGGGGQGGIAGIRCAASGTANTGGGAGALAHNNSTTTSGGSGVVIIRYKYQN